VSIDSPGTTDIDDALSLLEVTPDGVRIALHVVEPPAALQPGENLFEEAARRISSVYTQERRYPMLPEALSAGRYSLLAGEAREAVTFRILLQDGDGRLERISRSVVRVDANLDYAGGDALAAAQPETWGRLATACAALAERRKALGAMLPERWEVRINTDDPEALRLERRLRAGPGTQMVEELAILLNREAGRYCRDFRLPTIYRVQHRRRTSAGGGTGGLEAARFSLKGGGHEGLACDRYVQVTSPMRRFPDLLMLRQIAAHVAGEPLPFRDRERLGVWVRWAEERMPVYGEFERRAAEQWKRAYLSQNRGMRVAARVTGIAEQGMGQVYLTELDLRARAVLPLGAAVGDALTCRVAEVDLDLPDVWVQAESAGS
jgi:exoribonuclease-2